MLERNFCSVSRKKDHNAQTTWAYAISEQLYCCKQRHAAEIEVMDLDWGGSCLSWEMGRNQLLFIKSLSITG